MYLLPPATVRARYDELLAMMDLEVDKLTLDRHGRLVHQGTMAALRRDGSLEDTFLAVVGGGHTEAQKLSWLEA
jgi:hypothetical protein